MIERARDEVARHRVMKKGGDLPWGEIRRDLEVPLQARGDALGRPLAIGRKDVLLNLEPVKRVGSDTIAAG
jgi:hypothetical protein